MFYFPNTRKPDFRRLAGLDYDQYWQKRDFKLNKKLKEREVIITAAIKKNSTVLDIGCGNSLLPVALAQKGCQVTVADISTAVLTGYQAHGIKTLKIDLENPAALNLDFVYDYIILSEVLEHLRIPETALLKLKPQARFFWLTVPNSAFYRYRLHLLCRGRFFTQWVHHPSEHLRYWSHLDFCDWLEALDFEIMAIRPSNGLTVLKLSLYRWWPNLFSHQICYLVKPKTS